MGRKHRYWLMKSEPDCFSIYDLKNSSGHTTCWDGVRNYQARNYLRCMKAGDRVLFYHSNADPPSVVGEAEVVREAYPDHTAYDPENRHYDPKSKPDSPVWDMVDIRLVSIFPRPILLPQLKKERGLQRMELLRKGSRLSVQPVTAREWTIILHLTKPQSRS